MKATIKNIVANNKTLFNGLGMAAVIAVAMASVAAIYLLVDVSLNSFMSYFSIEGVAAKVGYWFLYLTCIASYFAAMAAKKVKATKLLSSYYNIANAVCTVVWFVGIVIWFFDAPSAFLLTAVAMASLAMAGLTSKITNELAMNK